MLRPFHIAIAPFLLFLVGCGSDPLTQLSQSSPQHKETSHYLWNDDGGPGEVSVYINLAAQRAFISRGDRPIGWSYVATGREGHNTSPGTYRVTEKLVDKDSNLYGWIENSAGKVIDHDASPGDPVPAGGRYVPAPMPYWMRLTSYGVGMHAGYIPQPGSPASHGCIRFPKPLAPLLFDAVKVGTPVTIAYGKAIPWEVHPAPLREGGSASTETQMRDGRRVVSPDDPWIVWPDDPPGARVRPGRSTE